MADMSILLVERLLGPVAPAYFVIRYLLAVRPRKRARSAEWWLLVGSMAGWWLILSLFALFGLAWTGRTLAAQLVFLAILVKLGAYVAWLEYRLRHSDDRPVPARPVDAPDRVTG